MLSHRLKTALFIFATTSTFGAIAGDPSTMQVRIPPTLAKQILQQSLGAPAADGDATISLNVNTIDAVVKKVDLTKIDEVIRLYGSSLFGLNFDHPFSIPLSVKDISIVGDMHMRDVKFSIPKNGDGRHLGILVKFDIPKVVVSTPQVWAHEQGLTPEQATANNDCGTSTSGNRALDTFAGNHIWARVFGAKVSKKARLPRGANDVIHVVGRFGAELLDQPGSPGRLAVYPLGVQHDIAKVLKANYQLTIDRLQVPKVRIKVGEKCFDGDSSGVEALFRTMLEDLKVQIVEGVADDISKAAMQEATKALSGLAIPSGKEFTFSAPPPPAKFEPIAPTLVDHTYVRHDRLLTDRLDSTDAPEKNAKPSAIAGVLYEINERLKAEAFTVGRDGALEIGLSDALRVNGKNQESLAPFETGGLPVQSPTALRVILNRAFFLAKTDLLASLRAEQSSLLPKEIRLAPEGLEIRPSKSGKLSLVAHVEIRLKELSGLKQAFYWLERIAGNATGVLSIPAQLDLEPSLVGPVAGPHRLVLKATVNTNLLENEFGQKSNLGKLYPKIIEFLPAIREKVNAKIVEAAAKLNEKPIEIDLAGLESASPLLVERVMFSSEGSLVLDASAPGLPAFVKSAKAAKAAKSKAEDSAAKEVRHD